MRVAIFLGFTNPFPGAGWTRIESLANCWSTEGHEVTIIGCVSPSTMNRKKAIYSANIKLFNLVIRIGSIHPLLFLFNILVSFLSCILIFLCIKPNLTIVSLPSGDSGLGALMACRMLRLKYLVDYRDEWEDRNHERARGYITKSFYVLIKKPATRLYSKSLLVSTVTSPLKSALGRRGIRSILFPNGADTELFKPLKTDKSVNRIDLVYAGIIGDCYSFELVLQSMKALPKVLLTHVTLVIAGYGPALKGVLQLAKRLNLSKHVIYLGPIQDRQLVASLLAHSHIGLVPLDSNPLMTNVLPVKFLEYCAVGIPVLATAPPGSLLEKMIKKYRLGEVVEPGNAVGFSRAFQRLIRNESFRVKAGMNGRALVIEMFNRQQISYNLVKFVDEILRQQTEELGFKTC